MSTRALAAPSRPPWARLVHLALLGTLTMAVVVLWDVGRTGAHPANLLQGGTDGPTYALLHEDFPDVELPSGLGLDGQQYYAMARSPLHLDAAAASLDRPVYRWQRPLFPWLARLLHPSGAGGAGLVAALFVVGLLALFGGGLAAGALSTALGGRTWPAAIFPLLPGSWMSLRVTMGDSLALALALAALALAAHRRAALAIFAGCLAVLARETSVLLLVGWAIARRTRRDSLLAVVPAAVGAAWAIWLRVTLPATPGDRVGELGLPFAGIVRAMRDHWLNGAHKLGFAAALAAFVSCGLALRAVGRRHVLAPAILANLALVIVMNHSVVGIDFGATRSTMPLLMLSLVALATVRVQPRVDDDAPPSHSPAGIDGPGLVSTGPSNA